MHTSIIELCRFLVCTINFYKSTVKVVKKEGFWVKHGAILKAFHVPIAFLHKVLKVEREGMGRAEGHLCSHQGSDQNSSSKQKYLRSFINFENNALTLLK